MRRRRRSLVRRQGGIWTSIRPSVPSTLEGEGHRERDRGRESGQTWKRERDREEEIKRQGGSQDKESDRDGQEDGQSRTEKRHKDNQRWRCGKRKSERNRKRKEKARVRGREKSGERSRRRKGSFLGQQGEMLPPSLLSQRSPGTRAHLSMVGQCRAVMTMGPPGPEQTCPSLLSGSSFQSPPYVSPSGSPLSSPSLSMGPEFIIYSLTYKPQASPVLCYVGLWGKRGVAQRTVS